MPRGYRSIIAALGLAIITAAFGLGFYAASLDYTDEQRHQPYRYAADKPIEVDAAASVPTQSFEYRSPCDNPKGREESDLCAQWRAAEAAQESALWTRLGFFLGIAGTIGLFWTLYYTREAVKDTGDATVAMRESNAITRDFSKRQIRAYVSLDLADISLKLIVGEPYSINVVAINNGSTPATNVSFSNSLGAAPPDWQWDDEIAARSDTYLTVLHSQVPSNYAMATKFPITEDFIEAITEGHIIIHGRATCYYEDVFGDQHLTQIVIKIGKEQIEKGIIIPAERGNIAT